MTQITPINLRFFETVTSLLHIEDSNFEKARNSKSILTLEHVENIYIGNLDTPNERASQNEEDSVSSPKEEIKLPERDSDSSSMEELQDEFEASVGHFV